jgi:hypothetical protein
MIKIIFLIFLSISMIGCTTKPQQIWSLLDKNASNIYINQDYTQIRMTLPYDRMPKNFSSDQIRKIIASYAYHLKCTQPEFSVDIKSPFTDLYAIYPE